MFGLSCGYWTDDRDELETHISDHRKAGLGVLPVDSSSFVEGAVLRGCANGVGTAENFGGGKPVKVPKRKKIGGPEVIEVPEDYTVRTWFDAVATFTEGGVEPPVAPPMPEPHPNEIATREAAEAGAYPLVIDEDGKEVHPLDVVGARSAAEG